MSVTEIAALIGSIAAVVFAIPAVLAFFQYRANSTAQRARWLSDLHERFYERDAYREVRRYVESSDDDDLLAVISKDPDLEQAWTDYLNFFEFVAYLKRMGELTAADVDAMFKYWIDSLGRFESYLKEYGYENLVQLLGIGVSRNEQARLSVRLWHAYERHGGRYAAG